jgi:hypothetical protein
MGHALIAFSRVSIAAPNWLHNRYVEAIESLWTRRDENLIRLARKREFNQAAGKSWFSL